MGGPSAPSAPPPPLAPLASSTAPALTVTACPSAWISPPALPAWAETWPATCVLPPSPLRLTRSTMSALPVVALARRVVMLITPPMASEPYSVERGPRTISTRARLAPRGPISAKPPEMTMTLRVPARPQDSTMPGTVSALVQITARSRRCGMLSTES